MAGAGNEIIRRGGKRNDGNGKIVNSIGSHFGDFKESRVRQTKRHGLLGREAGSGIEREI